MIQSLNRQVQREPVFMMWLGVLAIMLIVGVIAAANVLIRGLSVTNLSNEVPWGLWITVDLSTIALGAGAFSLSAMVYIFRVERLRKISRIAVFTGLIGYTSAMIALLMDIGRPERFWHPTIYWNIHSVLWEITMCVMLYATILVLEFLPIFMDSDFIKSRFPAAPRIGHFLHRFAPVAAVLGLMLSMLHQSSLGATYGVLVARPIWFKPSLPVMFILSAVGAGTTTILAVTVFYENLVRKRQISCGTRDALAMFGGLIMAGYLYLNMWDYLATNYYSHLPARVESIALLNLVAPYGISYWMVEIVIGALIPITILLVPRLRCHDALLMLVGIFAIAGIVVNRWNVTLSGLIVPMDWSPGVSDIFAVNAYRPSFIEWGIATLIVGYILTAFTLGLRFLPMFPQDDEEHEH